MLSKTEILKNIQFKTQNKNFLNIEKQNPFTIFDQKIIDFFDEISKKILNKPRTGDHQWYITDNSKFKKHYPNWKQTYNIDKILDEIIDFELNKKF